MTLKIYLFLIGWLEYSTAGELAKVVNDIENNISIQTKNAKCINKIVSKYFPCGSHIRLSSSDYDFSYLYTSIGSENCYNVGNTRSYRWMFTHDGYILYVPDMTAFYETMRRIRKTTRWNPRAKYIVRIKEDLHDLEDNNVFDTFLDMNIVNVVLLKDKNEEIEMLTYFPFGNGGCGRRVNNITSLGYCSNSSKDLFPDKLGKNWRNCSVTVAVAEEPPFVISKNNRNFQFLDNVEGLEQFMLSNIGKQEDIFINYIYVPLHLKFGFVLENGSYTGSLTYLQNGTADIIANAFILIKNRAEVFDTIYGYSFLTLKVYTSVVKEEKWRKVYKPLEKISFCLVLVVYIVFSAVIIILSYFITGNRDHVKIALRVLGYFYGNVDNSLIRVPELRRFMIMWIAFTLLICSFYNTAFYSVLTDKKKSTTSVYAQKYISDLVPCITDAMLSFFKYNYHKTLQIASSPDCQYIDDALETVAKSRNLYTVYFDYSYKFTEYKYIDKNGNKMLDQWDYSSNYMLSMYTTKGFPYLNLFRKYVDRFVESGLTGKHLNDIYFKSQLLKINPVQRIISVTLSDCRVHFGLLLFGMGLSLLCFILELNHWQLIKHSA